MATIAKLTLKSGEERFKAIIKSNGRIIATKTLRTRKNAKDWASKKENSLEELELLEHGAGAMLFKELTTEYMEWWEGESRRDKTVRARVKWWTNELGHMRVIEIRTHHIRAALKKFAQAPAERGDGPSKSALMARKRKPATINRMKASISAVLKYAVGEGYLTSNPARGVPARPENNKRVRYLSDAERDALLAACKASDWHKLHLLVTMALTTGARLGELLGLRWSDIDFEQRSALLSHTKNGESRVLTLPPVTIQTLLPFREIGTGLIFPSRIKPARPYEFRYSWNAALIVAGIDNFRFHDLRHSAASYLAMSGASLIEIAEILGHKSLQTTQRYAHLSVAHRQDLTDRVLGGLLGE